MPLPQLKSEYATAVTFYDPLNPNDVDCNHIEPDTIFFDWIREKYPTGFNRPIRLLLNGEEIPLTEMDFVTKSGDIISIIVMPAGHAFAIALISALISAVATVAATIVVNLIFGKPKRPKDLPNPDPVYSLQGGQNMVRLGEPIPVSYGKVITYPDAACAPYSFFQNNEMMIDQVLCIGQGYYDVHDVIIGDTPVSNLAGGTVAYWVVPPDVHHQSMGEIEAQTNIRENIITSIEVSDQELSGNTVGNAVWVYKQFPINITGKYTIHFYDPANRPTVVSEGATIEFINSVRNSGDYSVCDTYDASSGILEVWHSPLNEMNTENGILGGVWVADSAASPATMGPFVCSNPGVYGQVVEFDIVFQSGLYAVNEETGDILGTAVSLYIQAQQIDDSGNIIGPLIQQHFNIGAQSRTPQRYTVALIVPSGRYQASIFRETPASTKSSVVNSFTWTGLKFQWDRKTTPVYGNTTLLAIRIKATSGISSDAANKIRVSATRRLSRFGSTELFTTRSPADAFFDIATNPVYGLGRPATSVDVAQLQQLEAHWGSYALFDGIFNQKTTIWEALTIVLQVVAASPVMMGKMLSLVSDGRKIAPSQLFSDANILDGTFQATYSFDRPGEYAGIQVEYRDPVTFLPAYVQYPLAAVDLENVILFGCTNKTIAEQYCLLLWQRKQRLRQFCSFETEMEGFIPFVSSRILVSTNAVAWGEAGEVISAPSSTSLILDRTIDFSKYNNPFIVLRNSDGSPTSKILITPGDNMRLINLSAPIPIIIHPMLGDRRATEWAVGDTERKVKDFTIQTVSHIGENTTKVEGVIYDERVWDNTLPFLSIPI